MDQPVSRRHSLSLIERLKSDDEQTLKVLYAASYDVSMHFVLKNNGSEEDAKDIYQEAFLVTWRNVQLDRFVPEIESEFGAYLIRVAKNKWIDVLRKNKRNDVVSLDERYDTEDTGGESASEVDTYLDRVKMQYKRLGSRCRELLGRFYFQKQSLRDIAKVYGWTEASAKNNKYRCLKQLRDLVTKEGGK